MDRAIVATPYNVIRVSPPAMLGVAPHPGRAVAHESDDGPRGLSLLHGSEPGTDHSEDGLDVRKTFDQPFEVVGIAMALDPSEAVECEVQTQEHCRCLADLAVLAR